MEVGYREDDVYLHCAPLFHIGGLSSALALLLVGGVQVRWFFLLVMLRAALGWGTSSQLSCAARLCRTHACTLKLSDRALQMPP